MKNNSLKKIIIKALCIIEKNGKLLLCKGYDSVKEETFFRFIGGGVNFAERVEEGLRREMREELNSEIENLEFITVAENIFVYQGNEGHEICFLYKGDLLNKDIYEREIIPIPDAKEFPAQWVSISDILEEKIILYPELDFQKLFSSLFN